jgi:hypothetical protein
MMNMQEAIMGDGRDGDGKKRLTKREIRYWGVGLASAVLMVIVTAFMGYFASKNPAFIRGSGSVLPGGDVAPFFIPPSVAIIGSAVLAIGLTAIFSYLHRLVDEQEQSAWLWANTISWYGVCLTSLIWDILHKAQLVPPIQGYLVLLVSTIAGCIVWAWKKYF